MKGAVHSLESFGSVDGPGIRYMVFLQGCNMRCKYCHNADTWNLQNEKMFTLMDADEILDKAERFRSYWREEGGITVSGGDPLVQIDFLLELFKKAKERNINTCLDTSLNPFTREPEWFAKFEELMSYTDLLLVDIKHIDPEEHKKLTGQPNDNIIDAIHYLDEIKKPIWIRHVLVPGITDVDDYLFQTRDFIETLSNVVKIEVLPYHVLGKYKWDEMGMAYQLEDVDPPTEERTKHATAILRGELTR